MNWVVLMESNEDFLSHMLAHHTLLIIMWLLVSFPCAGKMLRQWKTSIGAWGGHGQQWSRLWVGEFRLKGRVRLESVACGDYINLVTFKFSSHPPESKWYEFMESFPCAQPLLAPSNQVSCVFSHWETPSEPLFCILFLAQASIRIIHPAMSAVRFLTLMNWC